MSLIVNTENIQQIRVTPLQLTKYLQQNFNQWDAIEDFPEIYDILQCRNILSVLKKFVENHLFQIKELMVNPGNRMISELNVPKIKNPNRKIKPLPLIEILEQSLNQWNALDISPTVDEFKILNDQLNSLNEFFTDHFFQEKIIN
jgi:hypothetical protein